MSELEQLLQQTLEDEIFTREERSSLRKYVRETTLPVNALGALRSKIFEMVEEQITDTKALKLLNWLKEANKILLPRDTSSGSKQKVLFSPGEACRNAIIAHMRQCRRKMDICVFTISDDLISREIERCHRRGIQVRIISDNDKSFDRGSDIERLDRLGIPVRVDPDPDHMHHKFAVFDKHYVLTGSYNWTRSAAERNEENILITNNTDTIQSFQSKFDQLWHDFA
ncbi:MAG: phospholipase D-like domain-containing protein [Bacteroidota bacterium]